MTFSAEINIRRQDSFDMTLDYSEARIGSLKSHISSSGFTISNEHVAIPGTNTISNLIELSIEGDDFSGLRQSVIDFLDAVPVNYTEDKFNSNGDLHSRFNLNDISVFDKVS